MFYFSCLPLEELFYFCPRDCIVQLEDTGTVEKKCRWDLSFLVNQVNLVVFPQEQIKIKDVLTCLKTKGRNIFTFHDDGSEHSLKSVRDSKFHFEKQNMFMILLLGEYLASICM